MAAPPLPPPGSVKSKGFTVKGALAYVDAMYGPSGQQKVIAALPPASRVIAERAILSSEWLPFQTQVDFYETIDRVFGKGDFELCRQIGRYTSESELSTINRIFLKLGNIELWMRCAGMMWKQYYSTGQLDVADFASGQGTIVIRNFYPISRAFCNDLSGWLERTLELSGETSVVVEHPECVLKGNDACYHRGRWK
jgi:predicted hydrocarbon binding protein